MHGALTKLCKVILKKMRRGGGDGGDVAAAAYPHTRGPLGRPMPDHRRQTLHHRRGAHESERERPTPRVRERERAGVIPTCYHKRPRKPPELLAFPT
jgi:hypothetical protein